MTAQDPPVPEFSRPVDVESLGEAPVRLDIHADAEERAKLARRFGLIELQSLSANVALERDAAGDIRLSGRLRAEVVQTCVVSLEPVRSSIDARFDRVYSPTAESGSENSEEIFLAPEDDEPAEWLAGGVVDVGEAVAETLGLEIDPFPRAPGAVFAGAETGRSDRAEDIDNTGPFAALAKLKTRR
jgi:uncharacterized metal-binding protein YceD (DUF177 family)